MEGEGACSRLSRERQHFSSRFFWSCIEEPKENPDHKTTAFFRSREFWILNHAWIYDETFLSTAGTLVTHRAYSRMKWILDFRASGHRYGGYGGRQKHKLLNTHKYITKVTVKDTAARLDCQCPSFLHLICQKRKIQHLAYKSHRYKGPKSLTILKPSTQQWHKTALLRYSRLSMQGITRFVPAQVNTSLSKYFRDRLQQEYVPHC